MEEEKTLTVKLNKASTSIEEGNDISTRLKAIFARLEEIEADKAESRFFKDH